LLPSRSVMPSSTVSLHVILFGLWSYCPRGSFYHPTTSISYKHIGHSPWSLASYMALLNQSVNSMPPPDITSMTLQNPHMLHKLFVTQIGELPYQMSSMPYYVMARETLSLTLHLQTWLVINGFSGSSKTRIAQLLVTKHV
jgi:hypothetical protein